MPTTLWLQVGFELFACSIMEVILAVVSCLVRLKNFLQESELVFLATFQQGQQLESIWVHKNPLGSLLNKRFLPPTIRYYVSVVTRWDPEPPLLINSLGDSETNGLVIYTTSLQPLSPFYNLFIFYLISEVELKSVKVNEE